MHVFAWFPYRCYHVSRASRTSLTSLHTLHTLLLITLLLRVQIYSFLPLGLRSLRKVMTLIHEEMAAIGNYTLTREGARGRSVP